MTVGAGESGLHVYIHTCTIKITQSTEGVQVMVL